MCVANKGKNQIKDFLSDVIKNKKTTLPIIFNEVSFIALKNSISFISTQLKFC